MATATSSTGSAAERPPPSPWWSCTAGRAPAGARRVVDPARYDLILFDQRGAGRSRPHAGADAPALVANTTHHLIADIERLRQHLGIERWLVVGLSWGTTLGLAYSEAHPGRVTEAILISVTTTTWREVEWITRDVGRLFPEEWERFREGVPEDERDGDLCAAYSRLLHDRDPAVREHDVGTGLIPAAELGVLSSRAGRKQAMQGAKRMGTGPQRARKRFQVAAVELALHRHKVATGTYAGRSADQDDLAYQEQLRSLQPQFGGAGGQVAAQPAAVAQPAAPAAQTGPPAPTASTAQAAPGWHPDPYGQARLRWWDGSRWSEHTAA